MNRQKLLLIDDEESIHFLYREELEEEGYDLYSAFDGEEGLEILYFLLNLDVRYLDALVILDINMPGINGIDVLQNIKKLYPHIPVILSSAYREFKQDLASWAADDYIIKSSCLEKLFNSVRKYVTYKYPSSIRYVREEIVEKYNKIKKTYPVLVNQTSKIFKEYDDLIQVVNYFLNEISSVSLCDSETVYELNTIVNIYGKHKRNFCLLNEQQVQLLINADNSDAIMDMLIRIISTRYTLRSNLAKMHDILFGKINDPIYNNLKIKLLNYRNCSKKSYSVNFESLSFVPLQYL